MLLWSLYFATFFLPVLFQAYLSWRSGFLTPAQMQAQSVSEGLPFVAHGAMWLDATIFAALMAAILARYVDQWTSWQWTVAVVVGFIASAALHWGVYVKASLPGPHTRNGVLTPAGYVHLVYMAIAFAVLVLFYLCTRGLTSAALFWSSTILLLHVIVGTHLPLRLWIRATHASWFPSEPLVDATGCATIAGTVIALVALSVWALR